MGSLNSKDLLKAGWALEGEYEDILKRKADNRNLLRLMDANGGLDEKEQAELKELYPPRERAPRSAESETPEPEE
jgi:hypothetical protein